VPGLSQANTLSNVSKITETYKSVVGGNVTAVTQVNSAVSTVSKVASTVTSVAKRVGKVFGF
jgi:hypothetical protein